jgi:hypothetical protein
MIYKMLPKNGDDPQIFARIDDDGKYRLTCTAEYAEFKKAVTAGAELQDADGNVMSAEAAQEFIRGLI